MSESEPLDHGAPAALTEVTAWCDGACSPNPGFGGWGAVLISPAHGDHRRELSGGEPDTTNNRMELKAAIAVLGALKRPCRVTLHTDSQYVIRAFTERWIAKWMKNGWRSSDRKPVRNEDLWRELAALAAGHSVKWVWVRGHSGEVENERCDALAVAAREAIAKTATAALPEGPPLL